MKKKNWITHLTNQKIWFDLFNLIIGIILIGIVVLLFLSPTNPYSIRAAFFVGGLLNIANGVRMLHHETRKVTAKSMMMFGLLMLLIGFFSFGLL